MDHLLHCAMQLALPAIQYVTGFYLLRRHPMQTYKWVLPSLSDIPLWACTHARRYTHMPLLQVGSVHFPCPSRLLPTMQAVPPHFSHFPNLPHAHSVLLPLVSRTLLLHLSTGRTFALTSHGQQAATCLFHSVTPHRAGGFRRHSSRFSLKFSRCCVSPFTRLPLPRICCVRTTHTHTHAALHFRSATYPA